MGAMELPITTAYVNQKESLKGKDDSFKQKMREKEMEMTGLRSRLLRFAAIETG
jgi:hypothetical protein